MPENRGTPDELDLKEDLKTDAQLGINSDQKKSVR